uniref:Uncharacterized protein n=1 Tax=Bactrocera latifrons TaxID=174628 RepID=A0A0K8UU82_BACLA
MFAQPSLPTELCQKVFYVNYPAASGRSADFVAERFIGGRFSTSSRAALEFFLKLSLCTARRVSEHLPLASTSTCGVANASWPRLERKQSIELHADWILSH